MKTVTALVFGLFLSAFSMNAASEAAASYGNYYNGNSYIFVEGGVEFSVFPDGQFDFVYVGGHNGSQVNININTPGVSVSYNSGYNYDAYVQYDDYGAVIQVEDVPIYYDEFGRIIQAGNVEIRYTNHRIVWVGGLHIFYNSYGYYSHCTGYISPYYRTYVYRPWHVYYARPLYTHCVVYDYPYRRYYTPVRYSFAYHRVHYNRGYQYYTNCRRDFYRPGSYVHYKDGRKAVNRDYNPNRRNTAVAYNEVGNRENKINTRPSVGNRGDKVVNTRPSSETSTSKGRPVTTNTRPVVDRGNTAKGKPVVSNSRPGASNTNTSKGKPVVGSTRPSGNNGATTKGRPSASRSKSSEVKPSASNTRSQRGNSTKASTQVNKRSNTNRSKSTSNSSRSTVQKRGRG
ncbi:MAG TPA: hypothetical protein PKW08_12390 [Flavobacteriaceae bacterium]|nr:hypothetical protein [Flavobacteriaceae bacterium]MCB9213432.1 hypothetical protein [Alteromonas sp.]HPF12497.1 hypothetical protein [Flavobacteriaceae bacterium]HQU22378.1 hypothetical protein [Flavobacteriaceae bacterium]HQU66315.1 hypothetical protein [Flavobacteriaceae bacterium]